MNEQPKLKVSISSIKAIEKELEVLEDKKAERDRSNSKIIFDDSFNPIEKQIVPLETMDEYHGSIKEIYNFITYMGCNEKSYNLVIESIELKFRRLIYEAIASRTNDKETILRLYSEPQLNKIISDINEYVSQMLHITDTSKNDSTIKLYLVKLLDNIHGNIRLFYDINDLDYNHNSYKEIIGYLFAFMHEVFPPFQIQTEKLFD